MSVILERNLFHRCQNELKLGRFEHYPYVILTHFDVHIDLYFNTIRIGTVMVGEDEIILNRFVWKI